MLTRFLRRLRPQPSALGAVKKLRTETPRLIITMAEAYMDTRTEPERQRIYALLTQCQYHTLYDETFARLAQEVAHDITHTTEAYGNRYRTMDFRFFRTPYVRVRYAQQILRFLKVQKEAIAHDAHYRY